jgi:hypothetical protein
MKYEIARLLKLVESKRFWQSYFVKMVYQLNKHSQLLMIKRSMFVVQKISLYIIKWNFSFVIDPLGLRTLILSTHHCYFQVGQPGPETDGSGGWNHRPGLVSSMKLKFVNLHISLTYLRFHVKFRII